MKLTLEYDGTQYVGWQKQAANAPTIQQTLEEALSRLFNRQERIVVVGAGRTDAGVHALNQVAHFNAPKDPTRYDFVAAGDAILPRDIVIKKADLVPDTFHAQNSALGKSYIYRIWNHRAPTALHRHRSLWVKYHPLHLDRLNEACLALVGTHDFASFKSEGSATVTSIRTVYEARFLRAGDFIEFHIKGSGFLKQMVRNIVGTLLQMPMDKRPYNNLPQLLLARDRRLAGPAVEPQGLYLERVFYEPDLDKVGLRL